MSYLDTSILTSYYCREERSERVQRLLSNTTSPTISPLVEVEFCCAVARKIRTETIGHGEASRILNRFQTHLAENRYRLLAIGAAEYALAKEWISRLETPLRVLDAIHLAAVSSSELVLLTADRSLAESADYFGVDHRLVA